MADSPATEVSVEVTAVAVELPSLSTRVEWYDDWDEQTAKSREDARRDRDYYDGHQWTPEEVAALEARNQPVIVKNRIARKINFILGEEIKKRIDPVARPRTPMHEDAARAATDALRYVEEEQQFDQVRSAVLKNVLVEGYGGAVKELVEEDGGDYSHVLRHVEWDRLFYDPHSRVPDFSDAKYVGLIQWLDIDDAVELYPEAADALRAALLKAPSNTSSLTDDAPRGWVDRKRQRVKVAEMYFRIGRDWYRSDFTESADLRPPERTYIVDQKGRSRCPLVMMSCYVDAEGSRYGVVRGLIGPQDEINKRSSKALHLLNVHGVIAERDFVRDPEKFQRELAKPDGYAEVEAGGLQEQRVQVRDGGQLAQGQFALLQDAKADIDTIGPSSSTLPDLPDSSSGRAFMARQQAAAQELGPIFDQLRTWDRQVFELDWACIKAHWTQEKWLRVTDDAEDNGYRFVALNRRMTRGQRFAELMHGEQPPPLPKALEMAAGPMAPMVLGQIQQVAQQAAQSGQQLPPQALMQLVSQHPAMTQEFTQNAVEEMDVDIILDESPDTAILAQEEFATLADLMPSVVQTRPDMAPVVSSMLIKASSLPNKRELLKAMEQGPDPKAEQQKAQVTQLQQALAQAQLAVEQTRAELQKAQAAKANAEAQAVAPKAQAEVASKMAGAQADAAYVHLERAQAVEQAQQGRARMAMDANKQRGDEMHRGAQLRDAQQARAFAASQPPRGR